MKFSPDRLRAIFDIWVSACPQGVLTGDLDEYFLELLANYTRVRFPLGSGNPIREAFKRAQSNPFPPEADVVTSPAARLLIALCYQLQLAAGDEPFFISTRDLGKLFGKCWKTMSNWMNAIEALGIIKPVEPADPGRMRAPRYRYIIRPK